MNLRSHTYFTIWILCITKTFNQLRTGCLSMIQRDNCSYSVSCIEYLDIRLLRDVTETMSQCHNIHYYNGRYYPTLSVTYKRINDLEDEYNINCNNYDHYVINVITAFNLSYNNFKVLPTFETMANLKILNVSNNLLSVAKLSNKKLYSNLIEIDYSYNSIKTIEVNAYENIYDKLRKLNLSHNALADVPETVFDLFTKLENLDLSYNRLTELNIIAFIGVKNLKSLLLNHNNIIDINSSLLLLKNLEYLSLKSNRLEKIVKFDFQNLINLNKLDLSCNRLMEIEKSTFDNMTLLTELDLSENALNEIEKETFKYTNSLSKIDLSVNKLKHLPRELFKGKSLSSFSIERNILEGELVGGTFVGLNNIIRIDIANQYLTSIEDYAFTGLEKLEILLLNNNRINNLSKNSFKSLDNIKRLDLSNNYIVYIDFDKGDLKKLQSFSLKHNLLTKLNEKTFDYSNELQSLDLSYNNISYIENNTFAKLHNLINFEIKNNPLASTLDIFNGLVLLPTIGISQTNITLLKNNTFQYMEQLKHVNLSHNCIADLQFNTFILTGNIVAVDLSYNKLKYFLVNTTDLRNLGTLLLNNNLLSIISDSSLKNLLSLLKVSFAYNNLDKISEEAFVGQNSLLYLDLSYNSRLKFKFAFLSHLLNLRNLKLSGTMTNISSTHINNTQLTELEICHAHVNNVTNLSLNNFLRLENIILKNNEISIIDNKSFYNVVYLQYLDLSNNHIKFIQPGSFKNNHDLKALNLSHNSIFSLSYGTLRGLINLDIMDLSFNMIRNLEREILIEAENLKILIVDSNRIEDIHYVELSDIHLSKLSIGDNPIPCKSVYESQRRLPFEITSLAKNEHRDNIKGITCNKGVSMFKEKHTTKETNDTDRIIDILRNVLIDSPTRGTLDERSEIYNHKHITNITDLIRMSNNEVLQQLKQLNDAAFSMNTKSNATYALLEKLLKVLITMNSATRPPISPPRVNATYNDLTLYVSKIKQQLEDDMNIQKESVLAEVDGKISVAIARSKYYKDNIIENREPPPNNSKFIEVCVALLLSISVGFLIYKTYKWFKGRSAWHPLPLSRRNITESAENSTL